MFRDGGDPRLHYWWTYARFQLGAWFTSGDSALGPPLLGWWRALAGPFTTAPGLLAHHGVGRVIATCLIVTLLGLLIAAGLRAMRGIRAGRARVPGARGSRSVPRPERDGFGCDRAPEYGVPAGAGALRDRRAAASAPVAVTRSRRLKRGRPTVGQEAGTAAARAGAEHEVVAPANAARAPEKVRSKRRRTRPACRVVSFTIPSLVSVTHVAGADQ